MKKAYLVSFDIGSVRKMKFGDEKMNVLTLHSFLVEILRDHVADVIFSAWKKKACSNCIWKSELKILNLQKL